MSVTLQSPLVIEIKLIKYARLKVKGELNQEEKVAAILSCVFHFIWVPFPKCQRMLWWSRQHWRPLSYSNIKVSIWLNVKTFLSTSSTYSVMPVPIHFFFLKYQHFFFFTDFKLLKKDNKARQEVLMQSITVLHHFENGLCLNHIWKPRVF